MKREHYNLLIALGIGIIAGGFLPEPFGEPAKEPVTPSVYNDPIITPAFQTVTPADMERGVRVTSITVESLIKRLNQAGDPESIVVVATPNGFAPVDEIGAFTPSGFPGESRVIILGKDLDGWVEKNFPSDKGGTR